MYISPEQRKEIALANLTRWLDGQIELTYQDAVDAIRAVFDNRCKPGVTRHT